ncbi:MAG: polysaccharide biosynthesis/export family protein [Rhizomicrobium sp.]
MIRLFALLAALSFALASGAFAQDASDTYRLGTGDKVRVIVYGEDDLGGTFEIDSNGAISLPLIGQVKAAGQSARQLETAITGQLADGYLNNPRVNVEVTTYRPFYVIGEVNRPGQYAYVNDMSVYNAVAMAGGYTNRAIESSVCIRRNGDTQEECIDADETTKIHPGDVVRVPVSPFWAAMSFIGPITGLAYLKGTL